MIVLLVFAVLAGAGTALSPCVLPVLPALLSASGVGGRRRPLLLVLALGGRRVFDRVRRAGRGPALQRVLGTIMILTAVLVATRVDVNFDQLVAEHIPDVNLTAGLECSHAVTGRLHEITGRRAKFAPANGSSACG